MTRARDLLLHPIALTAIAVLVINDHYLQTAYPCWLTGKLSDAAGMTFFPLLLLVILERVIADRARALSFSIAATALVFTAVKTLPAATAAFDHALGLLQCLFRSLAAGHLLAPSPTTTITDPTDLLAVPFVLLAWMTARSEARRRTVPTARETCPCPASRA